MGWVRLDDQFFEHPKLIGVGAQTQVLYLRALCYSAAHLTDGELSTAAVKVISSSVGSAPKHVAKLVQTGLWDVTETGWKIHDYLHYQPAAVDAKAKRETAAQRQKKWRENTGRYGTSNGDRNALRDASRNALVTTAPSHPIPSQGLKTVSSSNAVHAGTPPCDDEDLIGKALEAIADQRIDRAGRANINNLNGYRNSVLNDLRKTLADQIATAPPFDTVTGYIDWLEPMSPAEQHAAAQARIRARNDATQCDQCDGNGWTDPTTTGGVKPCPQCRPSAQTA